ncbi:alpha/beta fold hydrolase [Acidovorax radicis]|uniref:alpha/beta fold hydrolase n=1 Tax=Acidovorax radicis TaxID=758826 RepID=UPI0039B01438
MLRPVVLAPGHAGRPKNTYDSIAAFSAADFTEDLKSFDVPRLVIHGDGDQIVPIEASGRALATRVKM